LPYRWQHRGAVVDDEKDIVGKKVVGAYTGTKVDLIAGGISVRVALAEESCVGASVVKKLMRGLSEDTTDDRSCPKDLLQIVERKLMKAVLVRRPTQHSLLSTY
jgi:hypothetical protein